MPINLREFAEPGITALVIHEMQEGVVGRSVPVPCGNSLMSSSNAALYRSFRSF
jgi:hypothetical protein